MQDRGEKIVNLAREMLQQSNGVNELPLVANHGGGSHHSWKAIALVGMLATAGTGTSASWLAEQRRPINHYEKVELMALIHFTAKKSQTADEVLGEDIFSNFGIVRLDDLTYGQFPEAKKFLQNRIS